MGIREQGTEMAADGSGAGAAPTVATVLAIDCSWEASMTGAFPTLKRASIALDCAVRERHESDLLRVIDFAAYAAEISRDELPDLSWHEETVGSNFHAALILAHDILSAEAGAVRRIFLLGGSEPSAHLERGRSYFGYPPTPVTMRQTIAYAQRCVADGFPITAFWAGHGSFAYAKEFYDRLAAEAGAKVIEAAPEKLADLVIAVYERGRSGSGE
jgi:uncharacterized protein with von Willebrand factor type A (vWA) domain